MTSQLPLSLAAVPVGLFFFGIAFAIWVVSRVFKTADKTPTSPRGGSAGESGAEGSGGSGGGQSPPSLESLAARRRAELEALARRRVQGGPTAEQLRQRTLAQAQAQQRAALLRAQAARSPLRSGPVAPVAPPRVSAPAGAAPAVTASGLRSRQVGDEVEAKVRSQIDQAAARTGARPTASAGAASAAQSTVAPMVRAPVPTMDSSDDDEAQAQSPSVETPEAAAGAAPPTPATPPTVTFAGKTSVKLTPRTLQAALVVGELLAPPVCLRDPSRHPYAV